MRRTSSGSTQDEAPQDKPTSALIGQPETNRSPPAARTCTTDRRPETPRPDAASG
jgi:hypothetical protein